MLLLKKKEIINNKISYFYQPMFTGKMGVISLLLPQQDIVVEVAAECDDKSPSQFLRHAYKNLMEFEENKDYPEEKKVYWGL